LSYEYIIYEKEGEVAKITLNKPEKFNALTIISVGEDFADLLQGFKEAENDDEVKVIILKGKREPRQLFTKRTPVLPV